jgi:hypothetical protein
MVSHVCLLSNYKKIQSLESGAFGKSYLTQDRLTDAYFVIDMIPGTESDGDSLVQELERLASLDHPALLSPIAFALPNAAKKKPFAIVRPHSPFPSLASIIESKQPLSPVCRLKILFGVAEGLRHLHEWGIGYAFISLSNILVCDRFEPKLCEFGLTAHRSIHLPPFTQKFAETEVTLWNVFCFGAIALCTLTDSLFPDEGELPELPDSIPKPLRDLIVSCLKAPQSRPTFESIVLKFFNQECTLELEEADRRELTEYQLRTISPTLTNRSITHAFRCLHSLTLGTENLADAVHRLEQAVAALATHKA